MSGGSGVEAGRGLKDVTPDPRQAKACDAHAAATKLLDEIAVLLLLLVGPEMRGPGSDEGRWNGKPEELLRLTGRDCAHSAACALRDMRVYLRSLGEYVGDGGVSG